MLQPEQLQETASRFQNEIAELHIFFITAAIPVGTDRAIGEVVRRVSSDPTFHRDLVSHVWLLLDRETSHGNAQIGAAELLGILAIAAAGVHGAAATEAEHAHGLLGFLLATRRAFERESRHHSGTLSAEPSIPPAVVQGLQTSAKPLHPSRSRRPKFYFFGAALVAAVFLVAFILREHRAVTLPSDSRHGSAPIVSAAPASSMAPLPTSTPPALAGSSGRALPLRGSAPIPRSGSTSLREKAELTAPTPAANAVLPSIPERAGTMSLPMPTLSREHGSRATPLISRTKQPMVSKPIPAATLSRELDSPKLPAYASDPEYAEDLSGKKYPRLLRRQTSSASKDPGLVASMHAPPTFAAPSETHTASSGVLPNGIVHPGCLGMMAGNLEYGPAPAYPPAAAAARVQGQVRIQATVDRDGSITSARVVSGPPQLREAALGAVQRWRYKPYTAAGKPVPAGTTAVFDFEIE